jgi:hypothetical protein
MPQTVDISTAKPLPPPGERPHGTLWGLYRLDDGAEYKYVENPYCVDYTSVGGGHSIDGGTLYNAKGVAVGHADPTGPPGPQGPAGKEQPMAMARIMGVDWANWAKEASTTGLVITRSDGTTEVLHGEEARNAIRGIGTNIELIPLGDDAYGPNRGGDAFTTPRSDRRLYDALEELDATLLRDLWLASGQERPKPKPASSIPAHLAMPWRPPRVLYKTGRAVGKSTSLAAYRPVPKRPNPVLAKACIGVPLKPPFSG